MEQSERDEERAAPDDAAGTPVEGVEPGRAPTPEEVEAWRQGAERAQALAERLKRTEAEFVNETRRIRRQAESERRFAIEAVLADLLPSLDALERAQEGLGESEVETRVREGLRLVTTEFLTVLERHGVERILAHGQPFDPTRHEAITTLEADSHPPGHVCHELRAGYALSGRVVRPAQVIVARSAAREAGPASGDAGAKE
jgi:molecular chaperone GrpE